LGVTIIIETKNIFIGSADSLNLSPCFILSKKLKAYNFLPAKINEPRKTF
jgi:hypothetical protein